MQVDASGLHHLLSMALPSFWLQGGKEIASELFRNNPILYGEPLMSHVQGQSAAHLAARRARQLQAETEAGAGAIPPSERVWWPACYSGKAHVWFLRD